MNLSFENKVVLVTGSGSGSGIGLVTAKPFADAGASVVLADHHEGSVGAAAAELIAAGHKALAIRCDVADERQVAAMVEQTVSTFGRLDVAFNNAGVQSPAVETADSSGKEFEHSSPWRLELHEIRAAPNAQAGERRYRQLLLARWTRGSTRAGNLIRVQAWRAWADQKRCTRIRF
jgi:NAD(P)-dependent dehydrogenase (short-subunit alcohol dehydrogenase family)